MPSTPPAHPGRVRTALIGVETVAVLLVVGIPVALAMGGVLPREVGMLGFPAIVATLLADTFLFNTFLIRTGDFVYVILAVFVYLQAVAIGAVVRWARTRLSH